MQDLLHIQHHKRPFTKQGVWATPLRVGNIWMFQRCPSFHIRWDTTHQAANYLTQSAIYAAENGENWASVPSKPNRYGKIIVPVMLFHTSVSLILHARLLSYTSGLFWLWKDRRYKITQWGGIIPPLLRWCREGSLFQGLNLCVKHLTKPATGLESF